MPQNETFNGVSGMYVRLLVVTFSTLRIATECFWWFDGRGQHVRTKIVKVMPPRARADGVASLNVRGLKCIAVKFGELVAVMKAKQRSKCL